MDIANLRKLLPQTVYKELPDVALVHGINTPDRLAFFLGQCHWESAGFTRTVENLNYTATRLAMVFPKYTAEKDLSKYAGDPVAIGNLVYGGRMGNDPDEGYKYRGRGYIQLTGKDNYIAFADYIHDDVVSDPDKVADKYPLGVSVWYWNTRGLSKYADRGFTIAQCGEITRRINGAFDNVPKRFELCSKYHAAILTT